ncbi:helix-turn-helix domain-containing protein [Actinomadura fulvescens]|uniref:Helix-turn-helix domain-containing protein n=1 Tax=Actinomadura fulvescens TaxID=46160 RepID=A0ABN3PUQ9_9ACTN
MATHARTTPQVSTVTEVDTGTPAGAATHISTAGRPAGDQAEYWQHVVSAAFGPLHLRPPRPKGFAARLVGRTLGPVRAGEVRAPAHAVQRSARQATAEPREWYKVGLMLSGSCLLRQNERTMLVRPGDFVLYDLSRPVEISFVAHHIFTVMIPHRAIPLPVDRVSELTAMPLTEQTRTGPLLASFLASLAQDGGTVEGPHSHHLGEAIVELMTAALSERLGAPLGPGPDADLFQVIQEWIDDNLHLTDLSPADIARAHHLSVRQLYRVFQGKGTTVARYVRKRRLEHCRRDLRDPFKATQRISAVAARWGFPDAAAFSRAFRTAYGVSPSAYRTAATGITRPD